MNLMIFTIRCGIDEAGRGPLCGPVTAAAVIFPPRFSLEGIRDSKKLGAARRDDSAKRIRESCAWGIGWVSEREIDDMNIHRASLAAMARAFDALLLHPAFVPPEPIDSSTAEYESLTAGKIEVLVDGKFVPAIRCPFPHSIEAVIGGDDSVPEISAASILAKTARDAWIAEYVRTADPSDTYGLLENKGYPTRLHRERLRAFGPSPIHRTSFRLYGPE